MASDKSFTVKVLTPAGLYLEESTDSVKVPTVDGQIGVLPLHTSYAGILGEGTLEFANEKGARKLLIKGGITRFVDATLTVLADSVEEAQ